MIIKARRERLKGPSLRGAVYFRVVRGQLQAVVWPRKRGRPKTKAGRYHVTWFTAANYMARYSEQSIQTLTRAMSAGTPFYPRDIQLMFMSGRYGFISDPDGKRVYPMAAVQDVSNSLDIIAQEPGDVLTRGADRWAPVAGKAQGAFLVASAPGQPATWEKNAPAPLCGARLVRTSSFTAPFGSVINPSWQTADFDHKGMFDPGNPTRLTIPAGVSFAELTFGADTSSGGNGAFAVGIVNQSGAVFGNVEYQLESSGAGQCTTGPIPVTPGDWFQSYIFSAVSRTITAQPRTYFSAKLYA